ncbi:MAG: nucleotidyltransferase domain-containing protein, partial [Candidatus Pacearchaeota archaeon]|nr:nucleotidyltransferase domain-containing protein [Candidatus Pacearchaeota archaeon]
KKEKNILKEVLERINPSQEEIKYIENNVDEFCKNLKDVLKKNKIDAEVFVGGSFAKRTVIKKGKYDVDVFIRYDKKYKNEELSSLSAKILGQSKDISVIHGSRDYFRINYGESFFIELIPVKKIKNPKEHENITDLSYLHVRYINKKIKQKNILDEIKIAKAFCYAKGCYGAESYIHGFSGYSLELLVYYYKGFEKFIKAMSKVGKEKLIIDIEKQFKNKKDALMDLNSSKLNSPIILIDPTYKQRNVLAALSQETFEKFQKSCKEFLKTPSIKHFEVKKTDLEKVRGDSLKKKLEFVSVQATTSKPEGDIAGSKLLKFYNYLGKEISRFFNIKNKGFEYSEGKSAKFFFVAEKKKEIICSGPYIEDKENCIKFKKEHKNTYEKNKRLYAKEKINLGLKEFLEKWKTKNTKMISEMYIDDLKFM